MIEAKEVLRRFFCPELNRRFGVRLAVLALFSLVFFKWFCLPAWTHGESMWPTYRDRQLMFCWRPAYWLGRPRVGDVVMVRLAGNRVMLLKRIVALAGDTVEFRQGRLLVNGVAGTQPWQSLTPCDWELPPRQVKPGHVYVVGDNRQMPIQQHDFGQVPAANLVGRALF